MKSNAHRLFTLLGVMFIVIGFGAEGLVKRIWEKTVGEEKELPLSPEVLKIAEHFIAEIGIGFFVAVLVSKLWEVHHRTEVERRLQLLSTDVAKHNTENAALIKQHSDKLVEAAENVETHVQLIREQVPMLKSLTSEGVTDIYRRYKRKSEHKQELDPDFLNDLTAAIKESTKYIVLAGRAFNDSLGTRPPTPSDRLIVALEERLRSCPGYTVIILYGSTVHSETAELLQEYRFRRKDVQEMLTEQRRTLHTIVTHLSALFSDKSRRAADAFVSIRAMTMPPTFWLLATEKCMFFDPYLPFRSPGETFVFKVNPPSPGTPVDIHQLIYQCTRHNKDERTHVGKNLPDGHALWDADGDMETDTSLYRRILKSFAAQFVLRGQAPSRVFRHHLDRHQSRMNQTEVKRWQEIIKACDTLERHPPTWHP